MPPNRLIATIRVAQPGTYTKTSPRGWDSRDDGSKIPICNQLELNDQKIYMIKYIEHIGIGFVFQVAFLTRDCRDVLGGI